MKSKAGFLIILLSLAVPAGAQEISETLSSPVKSTLSSPKPPAELELCVSDAITQIGGAIPIPVRDGSQNVVILGYGHTPKIIVSLKASGTGTLLEVRTRGNDMHVRLTNHIKERCKIAGL